jgi:hypothetical protein
MNAELLIDEIAALLDGEDDVLDSAVGLTEHEVYFCGGGGGANGGC